MPRPHLTQRCAKEVIPILLLLLLSTYGSQAGFPQKQSLRQTFKEMITGRQMGKERRKEGRPYRCSKEQVPLRPLVQPYWGPLGGATEHTSVCTYGARGPQLLFPSLAPRWLRAAPGVLPALRPDPHAAKTPWEEQSRVLSTREHGRRGLRGSTSTAPEDPVPGREPLRQRDAASPHGGTRTSQEAGDGDGRRPSEGSAGQRK